MPRPVSQLEAINAIVEERNYQDNRWSSSSSMGHHETGAYITFLQRYLTEATLAITKDNEQSALNAIRKIGALAVACMEDNGVVNRNEYNVG